MEQQEESTAHGSSSWSHPYDRARCYAMYNKIMNGMMMMRRRRRRMNGPMMILG